MPQGFRPAPQIMIDFGTGQKFPQTDTNPTSYAAGAQYLYGVWDWNMAGCKDKSGDSILESGFGLDIDSGESGWERRPSDAGDRQRLARH